jgi:hypothetical protein
MKRFFQTIKKKKYKRQFCVLWVFLIAIELFCPVFCDEPAFAAQQSSSTSSVVRNVAENDGDVAETTISASAFEAQDDRQPDCNDECLCHATAIPGITISSLKETVLPGERIAFSTAAPAVGSHSPPYQPPKFS